MTQMTTSRRIAAITIAAAAAVGGGALAVHAATNGSSGTGLTAASTPSPNPSSSRDCRAPRPGPAKAFAGLALGIVSQDTALSRRQIIDQLRAGKTVDQIAGDKAAQIEQDGLAAIKSRLDRAASSGRLTADRETQMLAEAKTRLEQAMSTDIASKIRPAGPHGGRHGGCGAGPMAELIRVTAQQTGLTPEAVRDQLQAGKTINDIAGSKAAAVKAQVLADEQQKLSARLDQIMSHPLNRRRSSG